MTRRCRASARTSRAWCSAAERSTTLQELFATYPNLKEILWVQEEPKNMGARSFMKYRLDEVVPEGVTYDYVGRELRASPGEGYAVAHRREQDRIVRVALGDTRLYRDASFLGPLGTA
jgi:2-oxoglutarate dehydrogenase complex dehydrogenase (E1) component-like enzyme